MSIDRLQSRQGALVLNPEPSFTVAASLSSISSNQLPGGVIIGNLGGLAPAISSFGGGAPYYDWTPKATTTGSFGQTMATGGTISHYNSPLVGLNATTTANNLQMVVPSYPGQALTLVNCGSVSCSVGTIGTVPAFNITSATTQTAQVCFSAFTLGVGSARALVASPFHVTTTNQWPFGLWLNVP